MTGSLQQLPARAGLFLGAVGARSEIFRPFLFAFSRAKCGDLFLIKGLRASAGADRAGADRGKFQEFHISRALPVGLGWWGRPARMQSGPVCPFCKRVVCS